MRHAADLLSVRVTVYLAEFGGGRRAATVVIAAVESGSPLPPARRRS